MCPNYRYQIHRYHKVVIGFWGKFRANVVIWGSDRAIGAPAM